MLNRILSLFGAGGGRGEQAGEPAERERYEGFELQARPQREGGIWRVAGRICRAGDPDGARHDFVRVDTMTSHEEAVRLSLIKARQLVDERGDRLLSEDGGD